MIARVRGQVTAPIVLMGYTNPIYAYGFEAFARDAAQAGVDALLLVDLPPEEAGELLPALAKYKLELIFLATPTTTPERLKTITRHAGGFLYYVTVTGVTGVRSAEAKSVSASLARIKQTVSIPVVAGFGITTPEQAKAVGNDADGVVVGSALVKLFETDQRDTIIPAVTKLVHSLKNALVD
jgi:tryptophan synthase alpha chain